MRHILVALVFSAAGIWADETPRYSYQADHAHVIGSCQGALKVYDGGIRFVSGEPKDSRNWTFADIKSVMIPGPGQITIFTYEKDPKKVGMDRAYKYTIKGAGISEEAESFIEGMIKGGQPAAAIAEGPPYVLMVVHEHLVGSCNGKLTVTADGVEFISDDPEDSRRLNWTELSKAESEGSSVVKFWTHEDDTKKLGMDKVYSFRIKGATVGDDFMGFVWEHLQPQS